MAGLIGVNPGPLTLRELDWMASSKVQSEWSRTSSMMSLIANANRNQKKRPKPFTPDDFNPFNSRKENDGMHEFKDLKRLIKGETKHERGNT